MTFGYRSYSLEEEWDIQQMTTIPQCAKGVETDVDMEVLAWKVTGGTWKGLRKKEGTTMSCLSLFMFL